MACVYIRDDLVMIFKCMPACNYYLHYGAYSMASKLISNIDETLILHNLLILQSVICPRIFI